MIECVPITYVDTKTKEIFDSRDEVKITFREYAKDKYNGKLVLIGNMQYLYEEYFTLFSDYAYTVYVEDIETMEKV